MKPAGTIWVCGACGKTGADRETVGDESCYMWAVLCEAGSINRDSMGVVTNAVAYSGPGVFNGQMWEGGRLVRNTSAS